MKIAMNRYLFLFGCSLLFICMPSVAEEAPTGDSAESAQAEPEAKGEQAPAERKAQSNLTVDELFARLELPDNPTRAQCEAFVAELRVLISKRPEFNGPADPAVKKLSSIPAEHIGVLVRIVANQRALIDDRAMYRCANKALTTYEPESYRKLVVDGLAENPELILLIVQHGWYQAAKEDILAKLEDTDPFTEDLPPVWFQAFVEVAKPKHYELLHKMTLNYRNLACKLSLLDKMEGYDFVRTVNACWENLTPKLRNKGYAYINRDLRPMAIANGNIDALAHALEELTNPFQGIANSQYTSRNNTVITPEFLIRRHLDFRGTHAEIAAWFNANRDVLVFDNFTQRFQLIEDF
jgi:hypothetical protein